MDFYVQGARKLQYLSSNVFVIVGRILGRAGIGMKLFLFNWLGTLTFQEFATTARTIVLS
jgi:hypothetical protein